MNGLADLDELALKCRDRGARALIEEAIIACKNGAYRSAVISAWNAVALDFISKLRELEMNGDKKAKAMLEEFEKIRNGGDSKIPEALKFEREILTRASKDYELLTHHEREDLERLQKDRNRCAHPSMQNLEDPYQPSPEQARMHIRNAVELMLSREPVQGRAAFERICNEIRSEYFPTIPVDASKHLSSGPLKRASKALIKQLLNGILRSFLNDAHPIELTARQCAALAAISQMYPRESEVIIRDSWSQELDSTPDKNLELVFVLIWWVPLVVDVASSALQSKMNMYISNSPIVNHELEWGYNVHFLKQSINDRIAKMEIDELAAVVQKQICMDPVCKRAVTIYRSSSSWTRTEAITTKLLQPLLSYFDQTHVDEVLESVLENGEIHQAAITPEFLTRLYKSTKERNMCDSSDWSAFMTKLAPLERHSTYRFGFSSLKDLLKSDGVWQESP